MVQFSAQIHKLEIKYGGCFIHIPEEEAHKIGNRFPLRVLCTLNGFQFHAGIIKLGSEGLIIRMALGSVKKAGIGPGDVAAVTLQPDMSEYGAEMPEEFAELLRQDEWGRTVWEQLTSGKQRGYLHYINSTRNPELRISRGIYVLQKESALLKKRKSGSE